MLFNLSLKNIKKSLKDYSIYFFTLVVAVSIFYIFNSIDSQASMLILQNSKKDMVKALVAIIGYTSVFVSCILGFLIIYSNNFLIKRRKKEIGLYLTLGMSKKKVSTILVIETLIVGIISLLVGLGIGIFLSQFISFITAKLFEADMSSYKFIFSSKALIKTILYFSIIFILVMIFNVITLSRYKLIDLLTANKKNEKVRMRNKYITFITFILSIACLWYAYNLLFNGVLLALSNKTLYMIIAGVIGTFLLFLSSSGFLLKVIQLNKKLYYKNLNSFILKQVNNKINTTVISTTIISLMLLLTIGILSGSISMARAFNSGLSANNLTDFTIRALYKTQLMDTGEYEDVENKQDMSEIINSDEFKSSVKDYYLYNMYYLDDITIDKLLSGKVKKQVNKEFGGKSNFNVNLPLIKKTDYNNLMEFYNRNDLVFDITDNEFIVLGNIEKINEYYMDSLKDKSILTLDNKDLKLGKNEIINIAMQNYPSYGNDGVIVVSDEYLNDGEIAMQFLLGNYVNSKNIEKTEENFIKYFDSTQGGIHNSHLITKLEMEGQSVGLKVILIFMGLYLGIVFAISSATVLAIGQLSESSDNKERYKILRQIGTDEKMINKSLFIQIGLSFIFPLIVALFHAFFGLREINKAIKLLGNIDLTSNIFITALFIIVVYGGYYLATYLCSRNIIKEDK